MIKNLFKFMDWLILYRVVFFISIVCIIVSLFVNGQRAYYLTAGILSLFTSLYEQWDIKRLMYVNKKLDLKKETEVVKVPEVTERINMATTINLQHKMDNKGIINKKEEKGKFNFFNIFKKKKLEDKSDKKPESILKISPTIYKYPIKEEFEPEVSYAKKEEKKLLLDLLKDKSKLLPVPKAETMLLEKKNIQEKQKGELKSPQDVSIFRTPEDKQKVIRDYISKAIKSKFPKDKIKEAAVASGWPDDLFEEIYEEVKRYYNKIKLIIALTLIGLLIGLIFVLVRLEVLLLPYFIQTIKYASPMFYLGSLIFIILIIILFTVKIKKTLKKDRKSVV